MFKVGERVVHLIFGLGTVAEIFSDSVVVHFDRRGLKKLALQYAPLRPATPEDEMAAQVELLPWEVTFQPELTGAKHYMGSHWYPFFEDPARVLKRLPEILPSALSMEGFASGYPPPRQVPEDWVRAFYLAWQRRELGLLVVLTPDAERNPMLASIYPFVGRGSEVPVTLEKVLVWESGVEAQIVGRTGGFCLTFFDPLYAINRAWYQAGNGYQFVLSGIAYTCRAAQDRVFEIPQPEVVEFLRERVRKEGGDPDDPRLGPVHTKGMALLLPVENQDVGDLDDYQFHGIIKSVREIEMLKQPGWSASTTVLRSLDEPGQEIDLDIIITRKVWGEGPPPREGQDIEGILWLQGYLWRPHGFP